VEAAAGVDLRLRLRPHGGPGRLIVFCGVDGSGKTTLRELAHEHLARKGVFASRVDALSPGCRSLPYFLSYTEDPLRAATGEVDLAALCFVCLGDRLVTIRREFLRRLAAGEWLLCDRYVFTPLAELLAFEYPRADIEAVLGLVALFSAPDLVLLADVDGATALRRVSERADEQEKTLHLAFYARVAEAFRFVCDANAAPRIPTDGRPERALSAMAPHLDALVAATAEPSLAAR
jgi:dTMP kinase